MKKRILEGINIYLQTFSFYLFKLSQLFYNMHTLHLILLTLNILPSIALLDTIQGNLSYSLPAICSDAVISPDGNTLACLNLIPRNIELYTNTGYSFELNQTISLPDFPNNTQMTNDANTFYIAGTNKFIIMKKSPDNTYEPTVELVFPSSVQYFDISAD